MIQLTKRSFAKKTITRSIIKIRFCLTQKVQKYCENIYSKQIICSAKASNERNKCNRYQSPTPTYNSKTVYRTLEEQYNSISLLDQAYDQVILTN
ncbi:MAG: hypothetical protein P857_98 [Candidatus Xenolissoclinum pacificiensis L6]|uniref:Uncharacterized protein n=1 Tax=Candidatus Xenolissoclinum pacificiensis L6 TaxID=1401685 RepID=W2V0N1_9RICK|nr:MAG: hypothetical protein P857_98 [Candidatus Xenolissoclinum pacificiensis L6]